MPDGAYKQGYDRIKWHPLPAPEKPAPAPSRRAAFPTPMMIRDTIDPIQSMADGKWHDSKASLYRSYRPEGNPQGQEYHVVGNDQAPHIPKTGNIGSKAERQKSRIESIHRAEAAISRGEGVKTPD